jgi:hypothetical protein
VTLEDVLANEREDAAVLRARGLADRAADIERVCDRVSEALAHYLKWLSETEASLWSDHGAAWLRERFDGMASRGDAKRIGRHRLYRASALPQAANASDVAKRAARLVEAA